MGVALPPSALPGISPSSGEIRRRLSPCPNTALLTEHSTEMRSGTAPHRISPLEGEMSGRTEGGSRHPKAPHS
jgi:hypothetical protein